LEKAEYLPSQLKPSQKKALEWVQRRPCARRRGIGTHLPQDPEWLVEPLSDSTIYQIFYPLSQFLNQGLIVVEDITPDFLNWVFLEPETVSPPTPSIDSPAAATHPATFEDVRRTCRYWGGVDLRYTAATHMSNHLAFLMYHYALLFTQPDQKAFHPRSICIGGLLQRDGEKISKTKGNGIPLIQVRERFGADLYRLYIAVGTTFDQEFDFRENDIPVLRAKYETWKKLMFAAKNAAPRVNSDLTDIDRWLLSKFYSRVEDYWPAMDAIRFREAFVSIFYGFLKDVSYHTRRTSVAVTASVVRVCFNDYLLLMAPVVPHICEELYEGESPEETFLSLLAFDRSRNLQQYIDKHNEAIQAIPLELVGMVGIEITKRKKEMQKVKEAKNKSCSGVTAGDSKLEETNCTSPLRIQIVQACSRMFSFFDILRATLQTTSSARVMEAMRKEFPDKDWAKFIQHFVPRTLGSDGLQAYLTKSKEQIFLQEVAVPFLRTEFPDVEIIVTDADAVESKNRVALPGTPAIVLS
jgi:leucyl-tRNA synthetase